MTPGAEIFASGTLTQFLGDATFKQDIELGEGMRGYLFEDGKKRPVAVLWSHDIRVDKGDVEGPLLDISSLPDNSEIFDFTSHRRARSKEIRLSSLPIFVRGAAGSTLALSKTLAALPVSSSAGRQLLPFIKITGAQSAEVRLQNLLSRTAQGRVQITQEGKSLYHGNITVAGKASWSNPVTITHERTADGYILEMAIPKRELAPIDFKAGGSFGFSFIISDKDDEKSGRKRGLTLTPEGTEPFSHPELFTTVVLKP